MNQQKQEYNHIYQSLISFLKDEDRRKDIEKNFSKSNLLSEYNNEEYMNICERIAMQWILELLESSHNNYNRTIKKIFDVLNLKNHLLQFPISSDSESSLLNFKKEIAIYSYFLYFSGILFFIRKESGLLKSLKELVEVKKEIIDDNSLKHFLHFLKIYIDIVDPQKEDIEVFKELEDCFINSKYHDDIIFNAMRREYRIIKEVISPNNNKKEVIKIINNTILNKIEKYVLPELNKKYLHKHLIDIIESLLLSGQARLYHIAGKENERRNFICNSLDKYKNNSFALLQYSRILTSYKYNYECPDVDNDNNNEGNYINIEHRSLAEESRSLAKAKKILKKVLDLIKDERQFESIDHFNYRIKLEAVLGLAYIDYLQGLGENANIKYNEAIDILKDENIKWSFKTKKYLTSIILLNRGRNKLDNLFYRLNYRDRNDRVNNNNKKDYEYKFSQVIAIKDKNSDQLIEIKKEDEFNQVINIYNTSENEIKAELSEIAVVAHNNLGVYYLNEGLYEEAQDYFKKALNIDNSNPHSKYNLGVLYYRQGQTDRALTLIRNAIYLDPNFKEAKQALDKLGNEKKSLGGEWFDWWFKSEAPKTRSIKKNKRTILKRSFIILLFVIVSVSIGKLLFDLYLHDLYNISISPQQYRNATTGEIIMHHHDVDENAFLAIFGITIILAMLPFINKIKMGNIEMETESKGMHPLGPTSISSGSISSGLSIIDQQSIRLGLFLPPFWIYN